MYDKYAAHIVSGQSNLKDGVWRWVIRNEQYSLPLIFICCLEISVSSVQLLSHFQLFATPRTAVCQVSLSITNSQSLLKLMSIESVMPSNHLILCRPLLLLPSLSASGSFPMSQFFASGGQTIGDSAPTSVLPMNIQDCFPLGWTGWISLHTRDFQESLQHHSSKASILQHSAFFMVQFSHPYITTGKTIPLTRLTFVNKIMPLLFNRLV